MAGFHKLQDKTEPLTFISTTRLVYDQNFYGEGGAEVVDREGVAVTDV